MAVMIAIAVSGCNGDMLEMQSGDGMVPVEVNNVLSVNADITESRAALPVNTDGVKMGVFRMAGSGYTAQDNVEYTYTTGRWTSTTPILVGAQASNLCAYYPYNSITFTSGTNATLEAGKYEAGKDVSYATSAGSTVTNQTPEAAFAMKHAYARIKLAIKRSGSNFHGNCNISTVNLRNNTNFFVNRTLNISTDSYTGSANTGGWTYTLNTGNMDAGSINNAYDVLVPPQTVSSGLKITLVVDGVERSATIPATSFSNNLNAGSQYSISLLLTDLEVIPNGNVSITDWVTDNTTIESGSVVAITVTTINVPASQINLGGSACTESDKNNLAKLTWAGGNLKSTDNSKAYGWAPSTSDYGYYYAFNSIYTGGYLSYPTDPCTKLNASLYGFGWRTPSISEFEMLSRCTDKIFTNGGMWFMNNQIGLFLPASGRRQYLIGGGTEPTQFAGEQGSYWSNTASETRAYCMTLNKDREVLISESRADNSFPVRCVKG